MGELSAIFVGDRQHGVHQLGSWVHLVDHAQPVRLLGGDRLSGHQHLHRPARRQQAGKEDRGPGAGGQADHGLWLAEDGVVGGDDEVGADRDLAAAAVGHAVHGGDDRPAQLAQRVDEPVEHLALAQPLLLGHLLALVEVTTDGEGAVARPR